MTITAFFLGLVIGCCITVIAMGLLDDYC